MKNQLGDGSKFGIKLSYAQQISPEGIPSAIYLAKSFSENEDIWVSLGDNLIFGSRIKELYDEVNKSEEATIFIKHVGSIYGFGSVQLENDKIIDLKEKPKSKVVDGPLQVYIDFKLFLTTPPIKPSKEMKLK